jgi:TetR/AcrR family transcriptional regulator, cholesterol catabolism regulator
MASRREEIVETARTLFAANGFRNTSMRDIADACGMLAGSLYTHFESKNEILFLVLDPMFEDFVEAQTKALENVGSGAESVEAMIRAAIPVFFRHPDTVTIVRDDWFDIVNVEEFDKALELSSQGMLIWIKVLRSGIEDGSIRPNLNPEIAARMITSSLFAVADPRRYGTLSIPNLLVEATAVEEEIVRLLMPGLVTEAWASKPSALLTQE